MHNGAMHDLPPVFFDVHSGLDRESPGTDAATSDAWRRLGAAPGARAVDMGCGPGAASLVLAELGAASVLAVDLHRPFLDQLDRRAADRGFSSIIQSRCADMASITVEDGPFDLVWSEGAIYNLGFEAGLLRWRDLVPEGGSAAVSDLVWLTDTPPEEATAFFAEESPDMVALATRLEQASAAGWSIRDHVLMTEDAWDAYYEPMEVRLNSLFEKYRDDAEALAVLDAHQQEIDVRKHHGSSYGSVFFLLERSP
jgi:cyclopropane fatty-acyl-phospholipid synthase-like methyltransferase